MADSSGNRTAATTISQLSDDTEIGGRKDWGNKVVVNTGTNPVVNFAFMLRVEGVFDLPCKSVKGIRRENEFDYIQEGGLNDYVHLKRKAISKPFTFQVERYVGINWVDPLPLGTELMLPVILFVNKDCFPDFKPVRNYVFTGCTVISKDYGELNAEVSGLLVETVTIAYREMVCVDIPMDAFGEGDVWKFDGKKKEGSGKRHYNSNLYNSAWEEDYNSKAQMEKKANVWDPTPGSDGKVAGKYGNDYARFVSDHNKEIDKQIAEAETEEEKQKLQEQKMATGGSASRKYAHSETAKQYSSAKHSDSELSKAEMEKKVNLWEPSIGNDGKVAGKYGNDYARYASDHNQEIDKQIEAAESQEEKQDLQAKKMATGGLGSRKYDHTETAKQYSSAKHSDSELSREKMQQMADSQKYSHSATAKKNSSAKYDKNEFSKQAMEDRAKLWPEKESAIHEDMRKPEARLWPKTRSAKQITDFLKK
ncbi:MAG: hypothetical protein IJ282_05795 [Lachnospiraceae bacterium]|nr:hypothetical protein [Lachnospiraceae bacterium]